MDIFPQIRAGMENLQLTPTVGMVGKNILVLSPHPDDDIFGCGGMLHKQHQGGSVITSVYMTDGRKGGEGNPEELVWTRREEAKRAAAIIGINETIFLDNRDGELICSADSVSKMTSILDTVRPDAVYLPFLLDNHPDHLATNDIFVTAVGQFKSELMCYGYEVWTPLAAPNCVVDISKELSVKLTAIKQHESQLKDINLLNAFLGLSQYRSIISGLKEGNAEAFMRCRVSEYRKLWKLARL